MTGDSLQHAQKVSLAPSASTAYALSPSGDLSSTSTAFPTRSASPTRSVSPVRALVYTLVWGVFVFATLMAAIVARDLVAATSPENVQPFTAWLPESLTTCALIAGATAVLLALAFYFFVTRFGRIHESLSRIQWPKTLSLEFNRKSVAQAANILFVFWLPFIILSYPTGLTADTFNQLYQFQVAEPTLYMTTGEVVQAEFIDHHPVFDTLLYGAFWSIGNALGHQNWGLFLLVLVQSVVLAIEIASMVAYAQRLGAPRIVRFVALGFFALFPIVPHYAATVLKDVTYVCFFIPWLMLWFEAFRTQGAALKRPAFLLAFFLLGGFCILTKKLGVYILLASLVVAMLALRSAWKQLFAGTVACVLVFCLAFPALVYPAIGGVAPGGTQEALAIPIQQSIALYKENPQAFSDGEKETLSAVLDLDKSLERFEAFRADGAKGAWKAGATSGDVAAFLQLWFMKGLQHPMSYAESLVQTTGMLYIPYLKLTYYTNEDYTGRIAAYQKTNKDFALAISQPRVFIELNDYLEHESIGSKISDLPVISLFFTQGFYGSWLPVFALLCVLCVRRRPVNPASPTNPVNPANPASPASKGALAALVPVLLCVASFVVCPVASPRYVLPLLFTAPLYLAWAVFVLSGTIDATSYALGKKVSAGLHAKDTERASANTGFPIQER